MLLVLATGCGGSDEVAAAPSESTSSADAATTAETAAVDDEPSGDPHGTPGVDEDLTVLSSTMVYAEISNIMVNPDDYKGKVIRLNGIYMTYKDEATGNMYFACVNQDATQCCAQGIEFILPEDEYTYPDDYPTEGDEIVVQGTFDTYFEGEYMYPTLRNASLIEQ